MLKSNPECTNRAVKKRYINYMLRNPFYFKSIFNKEATKDNITKAFDLLRKEGLIAAADVPKQCSTNCKYCRGKEIVGDWND